MKGVEIEVQMLNPGYGTALSLGEGVIIDVVLIPRSIKGSDITCACTGYVVKMYDKGNTVIVITPEEILKTLS